MAAPYLLSMISCLRPVLKGATHRAVSPNSIAFYAIQRAKSARRSCGHHPTDALSIAYRAIPGNNSLSLDAELENRKGDDSTSLMDILPAKADDPATLCARKLDWEAFTGSLDRRSVALMLKMAQGVPCKEIASGMGFSNARVSQLKRELAGKAKSFFGVESLSELSDVPSWRKGLRAFYEARAFEGIKEELAEG